MKNVSLTKHFQVVTGYQVKQCHNMPLENEQISLQNIDEYIASLYRIVIIVRARPTVLKFDWSRASLIIDFLAFLKYDPKSD